MSDGTSDLQRLKDAYEAGKRHFENLVLDEGDDLSRLTFDKLEVIDGALAETLLVNVVLKRGTFINCHFDGSRATGLHIDGVKMDGCRLELCTFREADLTGSTWRHVQSNQTDFTGAKLAGARFASCGLSEGIFDEADLTAAVFDSVDIVRCDFNEVRAPGAKLEKLKCVDLVLGDCDLSQALLRGAVFSDVTFENCVLTGADFTDADFRTAYLTEQPGLEGAVLKGAKYSRRTMFPKGFEPSRHGMVLAK